MNKLLDSLISKRGAIEEWLSRYEATRELPLYSSVDIRDAGFKAAVVDTNLFPSGFNNLCEHGVEDAVSAFRKAILERISGCCNILILAEEHSRNTWYLENLRVLEDIVSKAGFQTRIATFLKVEPEACSDATYVELKTAKGYPLKIYSVSSVLREIEGGKRPCFIILNNDLISGIPPLLREVGIPIYPSIRAGWHARLKSEHFSHTAGLMRELSEIIGCDPWLMTCHHKIVEDVDINRPVDRKRLSEAADEVFKLTHLKYKEHSINEKPFVFLKPDRGTYGMGVMEVEEPSEILNLTHRQRSRLYRGKGAQIICRYLIQEGVPTSHHLEGEVAEVVMYQVAERFVGGFYRTHSEKSQRQNLNAKGMAFKTMCPKLHREGGRGVGIDSQRFYLYRLLAMIAAVAALREIKTLEAASTAR